MKTMNGEPECVQGQGLAKHWQDDSADYGRLAPDADCHYGGITDSDQKMNLLRSWAGAELTEAWVTKLRGVFEATEEEEVAVPAHT